MLEALGNLGKKDAKVVLPTAQTKISIGRDILEHSSHTGVPEPKLLTSPATKQ